MERNNRSMASNKQTKTQNKTTGKIRSILNPIGDRLSPVWEKIKAWEYSYLFVSFALPVVLMYLLYLIVTGIHPFGDGSILILDMNGQYVYFFEALRDAAQGNGNLLYSFCRALGGEFLGLYAYYLASPLSYIVCLYKKAHILEALLTLLLLKTGLCGLSMGYYLHKTSKGVSKYRVWIFSCLYALCSYAIVQQHNTMWIDALMWLPLLTLGIENLIKERKYKLYVISLAVIILCNFYIGYMTCIYTALYFFAYYIAHSDESGNPLGEKCHFLRTLGRMGLFSVIGVGIAAVMILGAYYSLSFGKNTFSTTDWSFSIRAHLTDIVTKLLPGAYDTVRPEGLPMIYCGVLTLMMLPFYYLSKKVTVREKIVMSVFAVIFILSFIISPVDIVWHGFQKPNWLNYRYSFMLSFTLLCMAFKGIDEIRNYSSRVVLAVGAALCVLVMVLSKFEYESYVLDEEEYWFNLHHIDSLRTVLFTIILVGAYCVASYLIIHAKTPQKQTTASRILLAIICVELLGNGIITMTDMDCDIVYTSYSSYNRYIGSVRPITEMVQASDDSFYRMEKTTYRYKNDNMALMMRGLSGSTSTLNKETIRFLENMGYASKSHWSRYTGENPLNDSLLGVKYILCEKNIEKYSSSYIVSEGILGSVAVEDCLKQLGEKYLEDDIYTAYRNPYALSLAYVVDKAVKDMHFTYTVTDEDGDTDIVSDYDNPMQKLNALATALLGSEEPVEIFVPIETKFSYSNGSKSYIAGHTKISSEDEYSDSDSVYAIYNATMPEDSLVYFYIPSDYQRNVDILVNEEDYGSFGDSDSQYIKSFGPRKQGDRLEIKMVLTGETLYVMSDAPMLYSFNEAAFLDLYDALKDQQFVIDSYTEKSFDGSITTKNDNSTVFTSIPYDEGWHICVDGQETEIYELLDGVIGFDIKDSGTHTLTMEYKPHIVVLGAYVSLGSLVAFIAIIGADFVVARLRRKKENQPTPEKGE